MASKKQKQYSVIVPKKVQQNLKRVSEFSNTIKIVPYSELKLGTSNVSKNNSSFTPKIVRVN